ncbi:hypothetical protein QN400_22225 [Pseudomonas sp. RTC3]|uniref:hypothetical protein n=1 Tax=unclassified Pseudomonas TaxID=196821 RepID=UPI002AB33FC9|nr:MULTISPECIES: hypothetical protein [unclassified Pseudomonas]MEB0064734.1 hypothetical protein [Pseudomonas sp. RTC3]MDY7565494.1 hypothetical protein [Pseudomonas sp. 5C2]MEB0008820.1 hypothetical protein [Pseudomonas sp. RTB2]MEB0019241.1 hypothetical protein [Pseudomonas sp. RTB3]MEB0028923.1 hypothetical protein [Pseudomonas sp. MH9.2]
MELSLETVALFSLKLAYEKEGDSPILRQDTIMSGYQRDEFGLLVCKGDIEAIRLKIDECLGLALKALGGTATPLGRELQKLTACFSCAETMGALDAPLAALKDYLKDVQ